jgi:hypothetical protein
MALTKEERDLLASLSDRAAEEDAETEGLEVWAENDKGQKAKLTGTHAKKFLASFGLDDDAAPGDDEDQGDEDTKSDKKPTGGGYFGKRKG